jgi:small conductance mechanosensitive channel
MTEQAGFLKELTQIDFVEIILILLAAWISFKVVKWGVPWLADQSPSRFRLHLLPLMPILQLIIIVTAVFAIVPLVIDPSPENLLAASGVVAISLGFAFQDYASSLIAGIVTIYERPYRIGDWIQIDDAYGEVTAVQFRTVQIVTPDDTVVLIPHKKLWDSLIFNDNNGSREHLCVADFYLHPEHDAESVRQELRKVALTSPFLQINRPITVIVHEKPWGTHYRLKAYPIDGRNQFKFTSDMTTRGKKVLAELGVRPVVVPHTSGIGV